MPTCNSFRSVAAAKRSRLQLASPAVLSAHRAGNGHPREVRSFGESSCTTCRQGVSCLFDRQNSVCGGARRAIRFKPQGSSFDSMRLTSPVRTPLLSRGVIGTNVWSIYKHALVRSRAAAQAQDHMYGVEGGRQEWHCARRHP